MSSWANCSCSFTGPRKRAMTFQAALAHTPGRKIDVQGLATRGKEIAASASAKDATNSSSANPPHNR